MILSPISNICTSLFKKIKKFLDFYKCLNYN
nr:MAG TPA: hypothetical protein [Caudoviricetes sp.]